MSATDACKEDEISKLFASYDLPSDCLQFFCMAVLYSETAVASECCSRV